MDFWFSVDFGYGNSTTSLSCLCNSSAFLLHLWLAPCCGVDLVVCLMVMHDNNMSLAGFPSCRLVLSIMGFFGMVNCYTLRVNLSVAIVAMVNATYLKELETLGHDPNETLEGHSVCEFDEETVGNETEVVEDFVSFALRLIDDI